MLKIEKKIESKEFEQKQRAYLGASQLGEPCDRALWYDFHFCSKPKIHTAREIRLLSRGDREESIMIADLEKTGAKCVESQVRTLFAWGHGSGHCDGIWKNIAGFKGKVLTEYKTSNVKGFVALRNAIKTISHNAALKKVKIEHFTQIQIYLHQYKLKNCLYMMVNKETDERVYLHITYEIRFAKTKLNRAIGIIKTNSPPDRIGDRNYYQCKPYICKITNVEKLFCIHRDICHNDKNFQKTCRTCKSIEIHVDGKWFCSKKKKNISLKKQLKACGKYKCI